MTATIVDNLLTLDYLTDQFGTAEITIRGESNGQTVDDTFTVLVNEANNPEPIEIEGTSYGRDILIGSDDDDRLIGLQGRDILTGNGGSDQFVDFDAK